MSDRAPGSTERNYAEWYVWAKRNLSPSNENCHAAARAATHAQENGQDPTAAARQSAAWRSGAGWESPADPWTRGYAEWFDWARLNLRGEAEANHNAAAATINALHAGADPATAMDAARAAVGGMAQQQAPAPPQYGPAPPAPAPQYPSPPPYGMPAPPAPQYPPPAPPQAAQPYPQQAYGPQPYPQPGFAPQLYPQQGYGMPTAYPYPGQSDASGMKRSPIRVALLLVLGNVPYYLWWMWELMALGVKERFPRAKSFWWTLIPIYGYVVLYRVLKDQEAAETSLTGSSSLRPPAVIAMLIITGFVNRVTNQVTSGLWAVLAFVIAFAIIGAAGYLAQTSSNRYLNARYPGVPMHGMSPGEIVATILGLLVLGLIVVASFAH